MTRRSVLAIFSLVLLVGNSESLLDESFHKLFTPFTTIKNVRVYELLNQLCNEAQPNFDGLRDACYGCFFRASVQPTGFPMLLTMANCADEYLDNSNYGHCQVYLRNATNTTNLNPKTSYTRIYCTFLECIRRVNKDLLLEDCVEEAILNFPNFNRTRVDQLAQLYVNTTACVLAKTRCSLTNPITGEFQEEDILSKLHLPSINAILVNSDYDINIVQLPFRHGTVDICAKYRNLEQATWPSVQC